MNHETQESADSEIDFLRAKLCYSNTCSNTLLSLEGAFVECCSQPLTRKIQGGNLS